MTIQTEALKLKGEAIFKVSTELEKLFFGLPLSLEMLKSLGMEALLKYLDEIKNKILSEFNGSILDFDLDNMNQIKNALKQNPNTNAILRATDILMDEESLSEVFLECEKSKANNDISNIFDEFNTALLTDKPEELNKFINEIKIKNSNSLSDKLDNIKDKLNSLLSDADDILNLMSDYFAYLLMAYYIIKLIISLFTTRIPSGYLSRYVGKLISTLVASVSEIAEELYNMFAGVLNMVIDLDAILTALIVAMTLYLINRKKYQQQSLIELSNNVCPKYLSDNPIEPFDENNNTDNTNNILNINDIPDLISNICDLETDELEYIVPTESFEEKLANIELNCPVDFIEEEDVSDLQEYRDTLASYALIENNRESDFNIKVAKGNNVVTGDLLGTVDSDNIYSPINGKIYGVNKNEIYFEEISDTTQSLLESQSQILSNKYSELNDSKEFLFKWVVGTLYPIMLANSPSNDGNLSSSESERVIYDSINSKWLELKEDYDKDVEDYELKVKEIASEDNVKIKAESESLNLIKDDIESEQIVLLKKIKQYQQSSINIANITSSEEGEYSLIEYYFEILLELNNRENQTSVEKSFHDLLYEFQSKRLYIEQYDTGLLKTRVTELTKELLSYKYDSNKNLINDSKTQYTTSKELKETRDYLVINSDKLEHLSDDIKEILINQILFLIEFILQVPEFNTKYSQLSSSELYNQVKRESVDINNFINSVWNRINQIPDEISEVESLIDDISILTIFSILDINGLNHRVYSITEGEVECRDTELNPNLGGKTITDFGDLKYWLKYFSIATLTGCALPGVAWATGFIGPSGPILFPVVYIPIKAIQMEYGFIVFGLTITGIVPMPFMLFVNFSTLFQLPLFDPVKALKNEISAMKLNLVGQLDEFKIITIKQFLDQAKSELDIAVLNHEASKDNHNQHKTKKPPKTKEFREERLQWNITNAEYLQSKVTFGAERFSAATKYSLLHVLYVVGGNLSDKIAGGLGTAFTALKQAEDIINSSFDALAASVETLETIIGPLPITLQPDSANWGFTLKMPVPLVPFGLQLTAPMIQLDILNPVIDVFRANNEGFMTPAGVTINYAEYLELIQSMLSILIPRDPFPPYENLKISNIGLMLFLTNELVPSGARSFGMPGMP